MYIMMKLIINLYEKMKLRTNLYEKMIDNTTILFLLIFYFYQKSKNIYINIE
jgi:hypothetical protein